MSAAAAGPHPRAAAPGAERLRAAVACGADTIIYREGLMSEYLRETAEHVSWLMRQRRGDVAQAGQLAAHVSRILHRRTRFKGLVGVLGGEDVRHAAGILRPKPRAPLEAVPSAAQMPPLPAPAPARESAEAPGADEVDLIAEELEKALEGAPDVIEEPTPRPPEREVEVEIGESGPEAAPEPAGPAPESLPESVPEPDMTEEAEETATELNEEAAPGEPEEPPKEPGGDVEFHIREAAAEAAAVEGIPFEAAEEPEAAAAPAVEAEAEGEAEEPAAPNVAPYADEMPFEAALEPQRLIPADVAFAQAADEVLFRRAIDNLGSGEVRGVREGIETLGRVPDDAAAAVLMNLYRVAPPRWRPEIAHQLVAHPGGGIVPFFCRVLDDEDEPPVVRGAALRGLYSRDRALAADYLLKALGDPDEEIRAAAATYLGWLRDKRAVPLLEQLLGDSSPRVAKAALHAAALIQR